jgi:cell division protein FtsA
MPVRIGKPQEVEGLFEELKDPAYATVVGLLLYRAGKHTQYEINFNQEMLHSKSTQTDNLDDLKLEHTSEHTPVQQEKAEKSDEEEPSTIVFDDLPDPNAEKSSPIKKFTNWAKQLF